MNILTDIVDQSFRETNFFMETTLLNLCEKILSHLESSKIMLATNSKLKNVIPSADITSPIYSESNVIKLKTAPDKKNKLYAELTCYYTSTTVELRFHIADRGHNAFVSGNIRLGKDISFDYSLNEDYEKDQRLDSSYSNQISLNHPLLVKRIMKFCERVQIRAVNFKKKKAA